MNVTIEQMAKCIGKELEQYQRATTRQLKEIVQEVASDTRDRIKDNAPKRTGRYAKSWTTTVNQDNDHALSVIVHAKQRYQLTHLLEYGHVKRGGGRTKAYPHIASAEQQAMRLLDEKIKEIEA